MTSCKWMLRDSPVLERFERPNGKFTSENSRVACVALGPARRKAAAILVVTELRRCGLDIRKGGPNKGDIAAEWSHYFRRLVLYADQELQHTQEGQRR